MHITTTIAQQKIDAPHDKQTNSTRNINSISNSLFIAKAKVDTKDIEVLLDEGSQVNTIHPRLVSALKLPIKQLPNNIRLQFANAQTNITTTYVPSVVLTLYGIHSTNPHLPLYFPTNALIMESPHDMLIGIPFLRRWNITSHFCNNTKVYLSQTGHQITIPFMASNLTQPCFSHSCVFHHKNIYPEPIPDIPPFIPPLPQVTENTQDIPPKTTENITISSISQDLPSQEQKNSQPPNLFCTAIQFMRHARHNMHNVYIIYSRDTASPDSNQPNKHTCNATNDDTFATQLKKHVLKKFPDIFPETLPNELPPPQRIQHAIDFTPDFKIPPRKLYRQSAQELQETRRQIDEYLQAGHIRPSTSSFGAPVLLVKKKDGTMRMCIDYRALNDITQKNTFPLPRIDDLHDQLTYARYFTKLDLYSGYHQIRIKQGDEHKTAFTSRYGTYEFLVMPFGLTNAPSTFQTAMNSLFFDSLDIFVIVYLDDILIYSKDKKTHVQHVERVLDRLREHKWFCKLKKCDFAETRVEYLGHIISHGTIAIDDTKMKAVREWKTPFKNLTEVQSFLGLVGYYRKFIKHFSHKARPLHEFSHKDTPFVWQERHTHAVNQLKDAILSPDCLAIFDPTLPIFLTTDACDYALGAVLSQTHPSGERPVAFISKTLTNTELKYSMWEKELFAVIWSVKYFRPYLLPHHFTILSDNKPATQLLANTMLKLSTSGTNRVIRWLLALQPYKFTPAHRDGKSNVVADALSRYPLYTNTTPPDTISAVYCQSISTPVSLMHDKFIEAYRANQYAQDAYNQLLNGNYHPRYQLQNNLIVTRETPYRIFIPDDQPLRLALFQEIHDSPLAGHPGFHKLIAYIRRHFVGPKLRPDALDFIRSCPQCQKSKPRHDKHYGEIMPLQPPEEPWQDISLDLITKLPKSNNYTAILVIVDRFSKMAHFIPTHHDSNAPALAQQVFDNIIRLHGFPRSIVSDRDTRFLSNFWTELFDLTQTTLRFSTANHPQSDGQTERTNRTLEQYLRIYVENKPHDWANYLTLAEIAYNNATHSAIGTSPFYLVYQRHINLPFDLATSDLLSRNSAVESLMNQRKDVIDKAREQLATAYERMIRQNTGKALPSPFQTDDLVLVHRAAFRRSYTTPDLNKFDARWYGPFKIIKVINSNAYKLDLPQQFNAHNVINVTFLTPYRLSDRFPRLHPDQIHLPPVEAEDDDTDDEPEYEIEAILDFRLAKRRRRYTSKQQRMKQLDISTDPNDYEFEVKWKGYERHEATWEPYEHLTNAKAVFEAFRQAWDLPDAWKITSE